MSLAANTHFPPIHALPFFSGFGGRVQALALPFGNADLLDSPPGGINGDTLLWVKSWSLEISVEVFGADTFENEMNARGLPFKRKDLLGLASGKVDLEGYSISLANVQPNNLIQYGNVYNIELIIGRIVPNQYRKLRVYGLCSSVSRTASADSNSPIEFKASFEFASPPAYVIENE
jgi:hypothetical protein